MLFWCVDILLCKMYVLYYIPPGIVSIMWKIPGQRRKEDTICPIIQHARRASFFYSIFAVSLDRFLCAFLVFFCSLVCENLCNTTVAFGFLHQILGIALNIVSHLFYFQYGSTHTTCQHRQTSTVPQHREKKD